MQRGKRDRPKSKKPASSAAPYKNKKRPKGKVKCPVWVANGTGKTHPELERVLARPFVSTVFFNPGSKSFGFPVPDRDPTQPHILGGLHARMKSKLFQKIELPKVTKIVGKPRRLPSSKGDGSRADRELERAIASGAFLASDKGGAYARAVWNHWVSLGHTPVLSQLPVVMTRANLCTAGDYFTVCDEDGSLHLWELKTGWPVSDPKQPPGKMSAPLATVDNTAVNRWQVQVELTRMAYEREMGMKIDGTHVIHAWQEREEGYHEYTTRVKVIEHADLTPPGWPAAVDMSAVYARL